MKEFLKLDEFKNIISYREANKKGIKFLLALFPNGDINMYLNESWDKKPLKKHSRLNYLGSFSIVDNYNRKIKHIYLNKYSDGKKKLQKKLKMKDIGGIAVNENIQKTIDELCLEWDNYRKGLYDKAKSLLNKIIELIVIDNTSVQSLMIGDIKFAGENNIELDSYLLEAIGDLISKKIPKYVFCQIKKEIKGIELIDTDLGDYSIAETFKIVGQDNIRTLFEKVEKILNKEEKQKQEKREKEKKEIEELYKDVEKVKKSRIRKIINEDVDYSQDIEVIMKNGNSYKFTARNIFDFGFVMNPADDGLILFEDEKYVVKDFNKKKGWQVKREMEKEEIIAYKVAKRETDIGTEIRL